MNNKILSLISWWWWWWCLVSTNHHAHQICRSVYTCDSPTAEWCHCEGLLEPMVFWDEKTNLQETRFSIRRHYAHGKQVFRTHLAINGLRINVYWKIKSIKSGGESDSFNTNQSRREGLLHRRGYLRKTLHTGFVFKDYETQWAEIVMGDFEAL